MFAWLARTFRSLGSEGHETRVPDVSARCRVAPGSSSSFRCLLCRARAALVSTRPHPGGVSACARLGSHLASAAVAAALQPCRCRDGYLSAHGGRVAHPTPPGSKAGSLLELHSLAGMLWAGFWHLVSSYHETGKDGRVITDHTHRTGWVVMIGNGCPRPRRRAIIFSASRPCW